MTNLELLAKAKKEGYESLTMHELRRLATVAWKESTFSLNGLVNYMQATNDLAINAQLKKTGISKEVVTVKWLLTNCNPNDLVKKAKDEKTGKLVPTEIKREKFGMWFISGTINKFHADIQAKAQSSQPAKVKQPEKSEIEKQADQAAKDAAKVAANKKRNEHAKKQKSKLKNAA